jgi:hypothetical protein
VLKCTFGKKADPGAGLYRVTDADRRGEFPFFFQIQGGGDVNRMNEGACLFVQEIKGPLQAVKDGGKQAGAKGSR